MSLEQNTISQEHESRQVQQVLQQEHRQGLLFVITGASGVGKGTVHNALLDLNISLHKSISVTTRKPRPGETHGVEYYFYDVAEFESLLLEDKFLEHAHVYGNYYGTLKSAVLDNINLGKDTLLEIDLDGAKQIKALYKTAVWIFIVPPSFDALIERLDKRGTDDEATKLLRLSQYETEYKQGKSADYVVVNDNLEHCVDQVVDIIKQKRAQQEKA